MIWEKDKEETIIYSHSISSLSFILIREKLFSFLLFSLPGVPLSLSLSLSLSFILIRSLLLSISLPYHLFFHSQKGRKALHQFVLWSWYERERGNNPMVTASEAFSWHLRGREIHIKLGPCGVTEGTNWDDGCHQRIESIFVSYSSTRIHSIQTVYKDFSNNIFIAPPHGNYEYSYTFEAFNVPSETPITRIDGYFDFLGITCLELSTNNGKMCSFGPKTGSPLIYKAPRGFTGFHGRHNGYCLKALGVYVNSSATKS